MTFAVLADIHGNALALGAVLADMKSLDVTEAVNLGDHFSGPLDPAGTADLLAACDFPAILGNHDRWLITQPPGQMGPSDRVAFDTLDQRALDWLRSLPATRTVFGGVFMCHGTPRSDQAYWLEQVDASTKGVRPASLQEVEAEAAGLEADLILCGHTHIPRLIHLSDGRAVLNPGSVGCPAYDDDSPVFHRVQTGTPNASYAIVEGRGRDISVTFRSVPYDAVAASEQARRHGRDDWAQMLMTGWLEA